MTAAVLPRSSQGPLTGLRTAWRIFWYGGLMSYGMLFNWARPSIYIPTLIGGPTFQLFFFAALGSYATDRSPAYFAIGNAVQVSVLAGVFGMTMAIANERWFGTLPAILATPANRAALFAGRFLPFVFNGLLVSLYALAVGIVFLGVRLEPSGLAVVGLALLTTVFSCTAIGALQGAISLRLRDGLFGANLIMMGILLFCGVNIPLSELPGWMQFVSQLLPFTHGLQAIRQAADGAGLADVGGLILVELLIGCAYAVAAFGLFQLLERSARRNATLDVR
ncbi:MAG TPA: ABC transporter permease [Candidatus Limnocylindria bacterium]|jgi:ABC-2 type transport system permease protein|nr:ABC transporter permease [Candidatus Limnocylindria bacterium]